MPDITAVDPTQTATPLGAQTMTAAQMGAPVAVTPDNGNLTVTLPRSAASMSLADTPYNVESYRGLAASVPNPVNTVTITADGGKKVTAAIDPNKTYIFKDKKTGAVEIMGKGEEGARAAAARGQAISSANKKNKSNWRVYAVNDPNSDPKTWGKAVLYDKHHSNIVGKIANFAAPVLGGVLGNLLLPGLGFALSGAIGAAGGSALNGVAQGKSIGSILKGAALSGLGAYAGGSILGKLGAAGTGAAGVGTGAAANAATGAATNAATNAIDDIIVTAASKGLSGVGAGLGGGLGTLASGGGSAASSPSGTDTIGPDLTVTGRIPTGSIVNPLDALGLGATAGLANNIPSDTTAPDITVTARPPFAFENAAPLAIGALSTAGIDAMVKQAEAALKQKGFSPSAGQVLTALQLLGGLGGAGGGGGGAAGNQSLAPIFTASLPAANPGFAARTPRNVNTDWATYATRPEESFFSNVPVRGYAEGGPIADDFAVPAMSDGRSDDRPIMASNGEYVVDAETVALLGNGSTEAGARKLDEFRVNLRKQKGAALSKGLFTPPARMPETYMGAV